MANKLMFEVGVKEAGNQLTELENRLKKIVTQYGKLEIKVKVDSLQTFINALENLGSGKQIEALQKRLDLLQVTLANAGMSGTHSVQEYEAAMKTASAVADQYRRKIEELTTARNKFNENTPRWREANDRLMGFKEDKTTLTIFAQEELAIKNLTEARARLNQETQKSAQQESEALQKVSSEMVSLKGNIESLVSSVSRLVEQFNKINTAEKTTGSAQGGVFDPQKFTTLQEAIDKIISEINRLQQAFTKLGENNSLSNLTQIIRNLEVTMSSLSDRIKLLPVDEQVKMLIEDNERLKQKLMEVGEAARYVNIQAGEKTKQKAANIAGIAGLSDVSGGVDKTIRSYNVAEQRINDFINRLKEAVIVQNEFAEKGFDTTRMQSFISKLLEVKQALDRIKDNNGLHPEVFSADGVRKSISGQTASQLLSENYVTGIEKNLRTELNYYKEIRSELERLESLKGKLDGILGKVADPAQQQEIRKTITDIENLQGLIARSNTSDNHALFAGDSYRENLIQANKLINENTERIKENEAASKKAASAQERVSKKAVTTAESLQTHIDKLSAKKKNFLGMDTSELDKAIERIRAIKAELESFSRTGNSVFGNTAKEITHNMNLAGANEQARIALQHLNTEKRKATINNVQLTESEQKLAHAITQSTDSMKNQSQVLGDLKMMAYQYLSVWGAQNFIGNIIEIGGQLEMQRLSIGAILGDMAHATDLFEKIKSLAIKSPFGVVELDKYTKQLSAYGFKYNELYDMTKRLADIAAGAGTDVSRLTLALGHVRAEGALSGYTLRQFAMNNIPMVGELAKKLSEVEGRMVSIADVRKRVSKKEIGFEDVIGVIKKLTDEGGMFYNMQETVSQSVKARFKNLKDSLDIMYGEIAESSVGDFLKEVAIQLTNLSRSWKAFIPIIQSAAITWGMYKASTLAVNATLGKNNAIVTRNIIAYKQKRAVELQNEALTRKLNAEEKALIKTRNRVTGANVKVALTTGQMTKADALRLVGLRKLSKEEIKALIHMGAFSAAEAKMALNGRLLWMNLGKVGAAIKYFGATVGHAFASIVAAYAPMAALFGAISVGMSVKQKQEEIEEMRQGRLDSMKDQANEGFKNLQAAAKEFSVGASASLSKSDMNLAIDDMMDKLREYSKIYNTTFNETFKVDAQGYAVHSLAEQYEILAKSIEDAAEAHKLFNEMRYMVEHALETSDNKNEEKWYYSAGKTIASWIGLDTNEREAAVIGNLKEGLEYYAKSVQEANTAEQLFLRTKLDIVKALEQIGHPEAINMDNQALLQLIYTIKNDGTNSFKQFYSLLDDKGKNALDNMTQSWYNMNVAMNAANLKMRKAGQDIYASMVTKFETSDMTKWPSHWRETVMLAMEAATKDVKGFADMSEEYQNYVRDSFLKPFGITVDTSEAKEQVNDLLVDLQNLVGKQWTIKIGVKGESAWDDAEAAAKAYQDADKKVKELEKRLERQGYKPGVYKREKKWVNGRFENGQFIPGRYEEVTSDVNSLEAQKNAEEYNEAIATRRAARLAYEAYGGDVSELDKEKKKKEPKGSGKDEALEEVKERIRIMKEAAAAFRYWREKVGDKAAWERVKDEFGDVLDKIKITAENIEDLKGNLRSIQTDPDSPYHRIKDKEKKLDVDKDIDKEVSKIGRDEFEQDSKDFVSVMKWEIEEMTRQWEIFNSIVESTGDRALASRLSGISPGATPADLKRAAVSKYAGVDIDFEKVLKMSEREIDDYVTKLGVPQEKIEAIRDGLKDWKKAQQDLTKNDIQNYAKWLGSLVDYQTQLNKIAGEYKTTMEEIARLQKAGVLSPEDADKRVQAAEAKRRHDTWHLQSGYAALYGNAMGMAKNEFLAAYTEEIQDLDDMLATGQMSVEEYTDKVKKLNEIMKAFDSQGFLGIRGGVGAYLSGGWKGLTQWHQNRSERYSKEYETAVKRYGVNSPEALEAKKKWETEQATANSMSKAQEQAEKVAQTFQDLASGADLLGNMFAALGDEGNAAFFSDAGSVLGGMAGGAQALSGLGPWGMAAGAAIGGITAFAQAHDKANQRVIEALQQDVKALQANTEMLKTFRERTLGYDSGELRRKAGEMYSQYNKTTNVFGTHTYNLKYGAAGVAMAEYYGKGGNGYQQEFENLKKERQDYIDMYNEEKDKKDSSEDALLEYKKQIAELDDQILNFTEDLANSLWGIDLKGWADQLSDAMWTAFENGTDAAEAWHDTVRDIISDVGKRMWKLSVIEPLFKDLQNKIFGEFDEETFTYKNGEIKYDSNGNIDMEASQEGVLRVLGQYLGEGGKLEKNAEAGEMFYDWIKRITGVDLDVKDNSGSGSTVIKGVNEQQFDLGLAYWNAMRADISVNRAMIKEYFPRYYDAITSGNRSLTNIESHTKAIMNSNDEISKNVSAFFTLFKGLKNDQWKLPMK